MMLMYAIGFAIAAAIAIAWIVLPLAVIGTKPLLSELIAEVKKTNALLERQQHATNAPMLRDEVVK
jgi:uncharacterized protein YoxC